MCCMCLLVGLHIIGISGWLHLKSCWVHTGYIHFGPWSLRSSVTSVLFLRTELTEDRSDQGPKWMYPV